MLLLGSAFFVCAGDSRIGPQISNTPSSFSGSGALHSSARRAICLHYIYLHVYKNRTCEKIPIFDNPRIWQTSCRSISSIPSCITAYIEEAASRKERTKALLRSAFFLYVLHLKDWTRFKHAVSTSVWRERHPGLHASRLWRIGGSPFLFTGFRE